MAGREVAGPEAASAGLFRGAAWLVTTDGATAGDLADIEALIRLLGARPVRMTAAEHDRAVALVSHLPQLLAAGLMNEATDRGEVLDLVAGSFRDLTRVAASDPALWVDVLQANRVAILEALDEYVDRLGHFSAALEGDDREWLAGELARAAASRRRLGPPLAAVGIALADRPGELARVGHALERSGVDVRDLQLRHAPFGGGGVLTVSVRAGDAADLRAALLAEGLLLVDY
jgi:prephenate dehydrogenase